MADSPSAADRLDAFHQRALDHTKASLDHMARYGIEPEGRVALFLPPDARQQDIHRMPYTHAARQVVPTRPSPASSRPCAPSLACPTPGRSASSTSRARGCWS